jgi:hypothetical protein
MESIVITSLNPVQNELKVVPFLLSFLSKYTKYKIHCREVFIIFYVI